MHSYSNTILLLAASALTVGVLFTSAAPTIIQRVADASRYDDVKCEDINGNAIVFEQLRRVELQSGTMSSVYRVDGGPHDGAWAKSPDKDEIESFNDEIVMTKEVTLKVPSKVAKFIASSPNWLITEHAEFSLKEAMGDKSNDREACLELAAKAAEEMLKSLTLIHEKTGIYHNDHRNLLNVMFPKTIDNAVFLDFGVSMRVKDLPADLTLENLKKITESVCPKA